MQRALLGAPWAAARGFARRLPDLRPSPALVRSASTFTTDDPSKIRSFAIIAHVDHGKTTLVDKLIEACERAEAAEGAGVEGAGETRLEDRVMDSGTFEKERGITISSKYTSLRWKGYTLNVVDTPGHADFGGEVERVLGMVDGAALLVDATEGPLSQTRFVLAKALAQGLRPVLVLNKVDRPGASEVRCGEVESAAFDAFANLGADDAQLDFPVIYASAREGWASHRFLGADEQPGPEGMAPLLDAIVERVPHPDPALLDLPFSFLAVMAERDPFLGRIVTGRVATGRVAVGDPIRVLSHSSGFGNRSTDGGEGAGGQSGSVGAAPAPPGSLSRVTKLFKRVGARTVEVTSAVAGDVVGLAGAPAAGVADTVAAPEVEAALPPGLVDPPTLSMVVAPNTSPLAGREGTQLTASKIADRLAAEAETNVSLRVSAIEGSGGESFEVQARGELQLGLLLENMRREGFELSVSPPAVLTRKGARGETLEPWEEVTCEVADDEAGEVIQALSLRSGQLREAGEADAGRQRLTFAAPSRGLIGFRSAFAAITRGSGVLNRAFEAYEPWAGSLDRVRKGVLVATADGKATLHALGAIQPRGELFVRDGAQVYQGMLVGEHSRDNDLEVNAVREKKLTNVRNTGSEEKVHLSPPRLMTLEDAIGYVGPDELIELTPTQLRLRKRVLDPSKRKSDKRKGA